MSGRVLLPYFGIMDLFIDEIILKIVLVVLFSFYYNSFLTYFLAWNLQIDKKKNGCINTASNQKYYRYGTFL